MSFAKALIEQGFRSDLFLAKDRLRDSWTSFGKEVCGCGIADQLCPVKLFERSRLRGGRYAYVNDAAVIATE